MAKDKGKAKGDPKVKEDGKTKEDSKAKDGKGEKPRNYSAFVLNKVRYNVGDAVLVQAANGGKDYVGTVTKIMASPSDHKNVQLMINWYYRPEDVNGGKREYHGENELLRSDHRDTIHVGTINGPCKIYKFEDFQANEEKILEEAEDPDNVFYWREHYDYKKGLIRTKLHVYCTCRKPQNPDELMIQCDACEDWFHSACIGLSQKEMKGQSWVCPNCKKKGIKLA